MNSITLRIVGFVLLVAAAIAGGHAFIKSVESRGYERGAAAVQQRWDAEKAARSARAIEDINLARAEETRREQEKEKVIHEAESRAARAAADAVAAARTADSLRRQLAAYVAANRATRAATADTGTAVAGPPAEDAAGVLADLLQRASDRAGILATALDASHSAGTTCEASYDSLTP